MRIAISLWMAVVVGLAAADKPAPFKVGGHTFTPPTTWKAGKPSNRMRAAQFTVPGPKGQSNAECVVFYFGPGAGGGVQANINRWLGQFAREPKPTTKVEQVKIGNTQVVYVFAEGTYMSGPPFGAKVPKPGSGMAAAVLGTQPGYIYIKLTGPKATTNAAMADYKKLIASGLEKKKK